MLDYFKARTRQPGLADYLRAYPNQQRYPIYAKTTGKGDEGAVSVQAKKIGERFTHHALTFHVFDSGFVEITGSLHKCWNSLGGRGAVNWNDFYRLDLFDMLTWLSDRMGVDLHTATIHRVEFGVNLLLPPAPPTVADLLSRLIYYGSGKPFAEPPVDRGYLKRLDSSDFYVKAYDKGTQYGTPDQRLRFEKGVTEMKELNRKGYQTSSETPTGTPLLTRLSDLNNPAVLTRLGTLLLETFDRCFWLEDFALPSLTDRERTVVSKAHDPAHVARLKPDQRNRLKGRYDLIAARLDYRLSVELRQRISDQWADLLEDDCKILGRGAAQEVQGFREGADNSPVQGFRRSDKDLKPCTPDNQPLPCRAVAGGPDEVGKPTAEEVAPPPRRCPVTGIDISHQPTHTRFVSKSTIRALFTSDRATFDELARTYLTTKQANALLDKQAYHIAHNVRNRYHNPSHNPRNSLVRSINKIRRHPVLFDLSDTLRLTADQQERLR